jgi:RHS repeat-associated protein
MSCPLPPELALHAVGDPIDAITGAFFDGVQDFIVAGVAPILWRRTYSSARITEDRGLGRGHSHYFDHRLTLDLDGIRYTSPPGVTVDFPSFYADVTRVARSGYVLSREGARIHLRPPADSDLIFEVGASVQARLVEVRAVGGSIFVGHDLSGRLASLVDPDGNVVSFTWDAAHIVSARVLARGATQHVQLVRYRYDGDLLVEMEDAYKGHVHLAYDDAGRLTKRTDRSGYSFHFTYDADGRCVHSAGDDGVLEVRLEYFPFELRTRVTKSDGGVWEYFYDAARSLTKIVDPEGVVRSFVRRPEDGQVALEIDGAGNEIVHSYDDDGRCVGQRDSLGRPIVTAHGHVVPGTPAEYELGRFATIPAELPTLDLVQLSLPPAISASLVVAQAPGAGRIREVRDIQGLLIREERDGISRRYAYDAAGNLRWDIDFDGAKTEYVHASDDHRVSKTDPNGYVTTREYTKESKLAAVTDAQHTRTVFPRDTRSRVAGVSRANVWKEAYRRDGAGRLIDKTAASGASLYTIRRGPQGEVLERLFASGGFERFVNDRALRVVGAETPAGEQSFAYEYNGQRVADLRDGKGVRRRFQCGDLIEHRVLDAFVTRYRYLETPHAREVVITDPTGREHRLRDHRFGVVTRELASGHRETVQYHPDGHCLGKMVDTVKVAKAAAVPPPPNATGTSQRWSRRYEYSGEGYLLARHDSARGSTRYAMDAGHRLVGEELPSGQRRVYEHDAAGNLLDHAGLAATYHAGNILADFGDRRYEHDQRHAVCSEAWQGAFRRFHRDERDQLVRVEAYRAVAGGAVATGGAGALERLPDWTARYDALNRRVEKTVAGQTTTFYWDTDRLAAEVLPTGALRVYVYADALAMTPMVFVDYASIDAPPESGVAYAVFGDHLGCPERIENLSGAIVWGANIAPYGAAEITLGAGFHQPLRWPGHYYDAELGLQYNRFRTYSPDLGRYLEPDPLGRAGGLENVYAYTDNPLFRVDLDGLCGDGKPDPKAASKKKTPDEGKPDEEESSGGAGTQRLRANPAGSPLTRPAVVQEQPMSCGPAAARMVIQTRTGNDPGEAPLRAATQGQPGGYDPRKGTNMDQVGRTLGANGVPSATYRPGQSVTDLQNATANGDPAIVHVNLPNPTPGGKPYGHFMVVDGVVNNPDGSRTVVGRDPGGGNNFAVPESQFSKDFTGGTITTN